MDHHCAQPVVGLAVATRVAQDHSDGSYGVPIIFNDLRRPRVGKVSQNFPCRLAPSLAPPIRWAKWPFHVTFLPPLASVARPVVAQLDQS